MHALYQLQTVLYQANAFLQLCLNSLLSAHPFYLLSIVFLLGVLETLAPVSLWFPATFVIGLITHLSVQGNRPIYPIGLAAWGGTVLGCWISYSIGYQYREQIAQRWPFLARPQLLESGKQFFARWGWLGVSFSCFLKPLRATVPLIAGLCCMPFVAFQVATLLGCFLHSSLWIFLGAYGGPMLSCVYQWFWGCIGF